jgi:hypothetical protein
MRASAAAASCSRFVRASSAARAAAAAGATARARCLRDGDRHTECLCWLWLLRDDAASATRSSQAPGLLGPSSRASTLQSRARDARLCTGPELPHPPNRLSGIQKRTGRPAPQRRRRRPRPRRLRARPPRPPRRSCAPRRASCARARARAAAPSSPPARSPAAHALKQYILVRRAGVCTMRAVKGPRAIFPACALDGGSPLKSGTC